MDTARAGILRQVFAHAGRAVSPKQCVLDTSIIKCWPETALDGLLSAKLLKPATDGESIVCSGCDERCLRGVEWLNRGDGSPRLPVTTCDLFDSRGPFFHQPDALARWQTSRRLIAQFVVRECSLTIVETDPRYCRVRYGALELQGIRRSLSLEFTPAPMLRIGWLNVQLDSLVAWSDQKIGIDKAEFEDCFRASDKNRLHDKNYQASRSVQEENKLLTEIRNRRMQRRFDELSHRHPKLKKKQLAAKLAKEKQFLNVGASRIMRIVRMRPRN